MKTTSALLLAFCALTGSAAAQETRDTIELREVVATATRLPVDRSAVSASITVLDGEELRRRGIRTVEEALRGVSGAALVQAGSHGAFASLFLRGGESDYVQVLIDGIQVNSPGEHFDFGNLTLENIERIEVMRGPGSVLYGSDAVTGVVQLFTNRVSAHQPRLEFAAQGGLGSRVGSGANGVFGSGGVDASLLGGSDRRGYSIGISHFRSDGAYAFNNRHSNTGVTGRLSITPGSATDVAATIRFNHNTFHYPTDGAGLLVDANQRHAADAVAAGIDFGRRLSPRIEARVQLGFNRNEDNYTDAPDHAADTLGFFAFYSDERFQRSSADLRINYRPAARTTVSLGGEYKSQRERGWSRSESEFGPFAGATRDRRTNRAAYVQLLGGVGRFHAQAGARFEHNELFGDFATYRGGVAAQLTPWLRARIATGTGFKEPRFYEQFATGFVRGNPALQPEESRSFEAGADVVRGGVRASATLFAQRFRNLIQYVSAPPPEAPNYTNLAAARADGIEIEIDRAWDRLSLRGSLTLLDTKVTDAGSGEDPLFAEDARLIRRPATSAALSGAYAAPSLRVSAAFHYVGERDDLDFQPFPPERVRLAAYTRTDLTVAVPLKPAGLLATLEIENVFGRSYEEARNFPARGRFMLFGLRYGR